MESITVRPHYRLLVITKKQAIAANNATSVRLRWPVENEKKQTPLPIRLQ